MRSFLPNHSPVYHPWLVRWCDDAAARLRSLRARWRARRELERSLRELATVAELDPRMLRDIGMSD